MNKKNWLDLSKW